MCYYHNYYGSLDYGCSYGSEYGDSGYACNFPSSYGRFLLAPTKKFQLPVTLSHFLVMH
ncbi:keratin-associated protein 22-2 [Chlorocebus sabaeus]|uniref:keratin-associated protein 22-2 n=1 Tax=Papio anubis TaxID=9555 RepID=UPI00083ED8B2|nr:keratin-associated protein 22-2 [Papio anubis]XP_025233830.1 keratin-associated protein 22-2 [Theropithecus gelada]XP_037846813.1 keratin-associated protein 22-2 [Chlorocebus sabaeus]XP_050642084.1 keratin-associated protein 22-2 [Macaca thibetana thibetana]